MKNTVSSLVYLITFFAMYFAFTLFGALLFGCNYTTVLESRDWFVMYTLFLGWWISLIPSRDCYQLLEKKGL